MHFLNKEYYGCKNGLIKLIHVFDVKVEKQNPFLYLLAAETDYVVWCGGFSIIPGQRLRVMDRHHTEKIIREAAQRPDDRVRYITDVLDPARGMANPRKNETASTFGIVMDNPDLAKVILCIILYVADSQCIFRAYQLVSQSCMLICFQLED